MAKSSSVWIIEAWKRECRSEYCLIKREAEDSLKDLGINMQLDKGKVVLDGKEMTKSWKECWKTVKERIKTGTESKRKTDYAEKQM